MIRKIILLPYIVCCLFSPYALAQDHSSGTLFIQHIGNELDQHAKNYFPWFTIFNYGLTTATISYEPYETIMKLNNYDIEVKHQGEWHLNERHDAIAANDVYPLSPLSKCIVFIEPDARNVFSDFKEFRIRIEGNYSNSFSYSTVSEAERNHNFGQWDNVTEKIMIELGFPALFFKDSKNPTSAFKTLVNNLSCLTEYSLEDSPVWGPDILSINQNPYMWFVIRIQPLNHEVYYNVTISIYPLLFSKKHFLEIIEFVMHNKPDSFLSLGNNFDRIRGANLENILNFPFYKETGLIIDVRIYGVITPEHLALASDIKKELTIALYELLLNK